MALLPRRFRGSKAGQGSSSLILPPNLFAFGDGPVTGGGSSVTLPTWPTTYTGPTYYVSASSTVTTFSGNSRSSPCQATYALDNAASLSTIIFLGGSTAYAASGTSTLKLNRATNIHLKLVSDVPAFTDLVGLRPTALTLAQMDALETSCIVGRDLTNSARFRNFNIISGGNIWVEGFRMQNPDNWTVSATLGGSTSTSTARVWFYLCHLNQGNSKNLQIGPFANNNINKLNVAHKCWFKSTNELGDSGFPVDGGIGGAGTAVTDYGMTMHQNSGATMALECGFQMRANHMFSTKRGVGLNTQTINNRVEGCLFASWNRTYTRTSTMLELGQECDEGSTDYTSWATDVFNNTFCDPNGRVLYVKNANNVTFTGNRVIRMADFLFATLDSGYTDRSTAQTGPVLGGPVYIGNNILMESAPTCTLYSMGNACEYTFENNSTANLVPITTHAAFRDPARVSGTATRPVVTRVGGNACGFAAASAA